jgi:hypothetical protein
LRKGIDYNSESVVGSVDSVKRVIDVSRSDNNDAWAESNDVEPSLQKLQNVIKEESDQNKLENNLTINDEKESEPSEIKKVPVEDQVYNYPDGCTYKGYLDQNGLFSGFGICT